MRLFACLLFLLGVWGPSLHANTIVRFTVPPYGSWEVELFDDDKPITVSNFLAYANSGAYNNGFMHRWVPGFVIQGGGFTVTNRNTQEEQVVPVVTGPPILNEYFVGPRLSNTYGTIAMARSGQTNSATSQFFFNLGDNSQNLDNQNGGFTVFGKVISGQAVLNQFLAFDSVDGPWWVDAGGVFSELPLTSPPSGSVHIDQLVFTTVTVVKRHQRITFAPIGTRTFGDQAFALFASSSSSLPVSYQIVSGPAIVSDGQLLIQGAGAVTVRAFHVGNETYAPASVEQTFTVNKKAQTITFAQPENQLLSAGQMALSATATSSRPAPTLTIVGGPATLSNQFAVFTGELGRVTVRASHAGGVNYLAAPDVERSFEILGVVNATSSAGGTVVKTPDQPAYTNDTQVTLTAQPAAGFSFIRWTGDTNATSNPLTLNVTRNWAVHAEFGSAQRPTLNALSYLNGVFTMQLNGAPGSPYTLEKSTNLVTWVDLQSGTNGSGQQTLTDTTATEEKAFYRVRQGQP